MSELNLNLAVVKLKNEQTNLCPNTLHGDSKLRIRLIHYNIKSSRTACNVSPRKPSSRWRVPNEPEVHMSVEYRAHLGDTAPSKNTYKMDPPVTPPMPEHVPGEEILTKHKEAIR
jgi:hypothetical protein